MPRDSGGNYTLPPENPVVPGTVIDTDWANPTMQDIAIAMSDSLSRSGNGDMLAPLRGPDGSAAVPTYSFSLDPTTGIYREPGSGNVIWAHRGTPVFRVTQDGIEQSDGLGGWEPLTPRDARNTPFDPAPTALTSTNVQDAIEEVFALIGGGGAVHARDVQFDDTNVYYGAPTVQLALEITADDIAGNASDILTIAGDVALNTGDIATLTSTVLGHTDDINRNTGDIGVINTWISNHEGDYNVLRGRVDQNELDIAANASAISSNDTDISNLFSRMNTAESDINTNETNIAANSTLITGLRTDVDSILGAFPGGVLQVANGGTGVTTSTGTGSTVRSNSPTINTPTITGGTISNATLNSATIGSGGLNLGSSSTATTQAWSDNDTSVATTGFVHSVLSALSNASVLIGSNGNGNYARLTDKNGTDKFVVQWGGATGAANNGYQAFPRSFPNGGNVRVVATVWGATTNTGVAWSPVVGSITASGFRYGSAYSFVWIAVGRQ